MIEKPIYLHIFDRELRENERIQLSDSMALEIVLTVSFIAPNFYVGLSNLLESSEDLPSAVKLVFELEKCGVAIIITSANSFEEFLEKRKELYYEDKERYSMYFKPAPLLSPLNPIIETSSTTDFLRQSILVDFKKYIPTPLWNKYQDINSILKSDEDGITKEIITKKVTLDAKQESSLGHEISLRYTKRYLTILQGCLLLHIPGYEAYDKLSSDKLLYEYWQPIIKASILRFLQEKSIEELSITVANLKHNEFFQSFIVVLSDLFYGLDEMLENNQNEQSKRWKLCQILNNEIMPFFNSLQELNSELLFSTAKKELASIEIKYQIKTKKTMEKLLPVVLLVVATDAEMINVIKYYKQKGNTISHYEINNLTYWDLGVVRNKQIKMIRIGMGAKSASGSILSIDEAIKTIKPKYIIMVGIAFGLKEDKQALNDILVSSEIVDYGTVKLTEEKEINRGERVQASRILLDRFRNAKVLWPDSNVHIGQIITNDVLVNKDGFVSSLIAQFPDAIGGEMEGCGLLAHKEVDWILVKSICDFGHEKDDLHQAEAANNAIAYVDFVLSEFDF